MKSLPYLPSTWEPGLLRQRRRKVGGNGSWSIWLNMEVSEFVESWFKRKNWRVFEFQRATWEAYLRGESGLVHAATGTGKTYAVALGPLIEWLRKGAAAAESVESAPNHSRQNLARAPAVPIQLLWITPLRALAADTRQALEKPFKELELPWTVQMRTGDTSATLRQRQRETPPSILVITPENLSLMLSYPETRENFRTLQCVVVDEWHELIGTKRGIQTELGLARLRQWLPAVRLWGLSATLGNTEQAMHVLLGRDDRGPRPGTLIAADIAKETDVETLLPRDIQTFPWAGHAGLVQLPGVLRAIESAKSTLLFINTRSQAELWYRAILLQRPEWGTKIALHHGSLEKGLRSAVETQLHAGRLRCVVATSSLDLGVDFSPVDQVLQVGGPKGVARLLQRAGRSNHRPGQASRILCVPTQAIEVVEFAAAREAIGRGEIEARRPLERTLDVLAQHLVTIALGEGFEAEPFLREIRSTHAFRDLSDDEWQWAIDFVTRGGPALKAYPRYAKVLHRNGRYVMDPGPLARLHRLSIGTITSDPLLRVQLQRGQTLGTIEESFLSKVNPGEPFQFAGRVLELVTIRDMTAHVRPARKPKGLIPQWMGGRLPLSTELAAAVRRRLDEAKEGIFRGPEMECAEPFLRFQAEVSTIPASNELLIETTRSREGFHVFLFPFAGRLVHQGLAALLAYRLARQVPRSVVMTANDYGLALVSREPWGLDDDEWHVAVTTDQLVDDVLACLNATEMARRQFRDIARIAGLLFQGYPGAGKSQKQLQASSSLFYDVFKRYDPGNLLLGQAQREVLESQLEYRRLHESLAAMKAITIVQKETTRFSPLAYPLWADSLQQNQLSTERWTDRVKRMALEREEVEEVRQQSPIIESVKEFEARWKKQVARLPKYFRGS